MKPVLLPKTLREAFEALERHPRARVYAGGTDLLVALRAGKGDPPGCLAAMAAGSTAT